VRVLSICGSLNVDSSNRALLDLAKELAPSTDLLVDAPDLGSLPHFAPGTEPEPAAVADLRAAVTAADAVLIAAPEYAHSLPGSLKNALDWLVGSGELYGKPTAVLVATPRVGGGDRGRAALGVVLDALGVDVRGSESVIVASGNPPGAEARRLVAETLARLATS
jgi:chromate reductase, NAD(P)H dehydrogenase (quinone)